MDLSVVSQSSMEVHHESDAAPGMIPPRGLQPNRITMPNHAGHPPKASVIVHAGNSYQPIHGDDVAIDHRHPHLVQQAIFEDPRHSIVPSNVGGNEMGLDLSNPSKSIGQTAKMQIIGNCEESSQPSSSGLNQQRYTSFCSCLRIVLRCQGIVLLSYSFLLILDCDYKSLIKHSFGSSLAGEVQKSESHSSSVDLVGANDNVSNTVVVETTHVQPSVTLHRLIVLTYKY